MVESSPDESHFLPYYVDGWMSVTTSVNMILFHFQFTMIVRRRGRNRKRKKMKRRTGRRRKL